MAYRLNLKIRSVANYIIDKLQAEYHSLSLWYFVSFISGIVTYFSLTFEPSARYVISSFAASLSFLYLRKYGIIWQFFAGLIIAFTCGMLVAKYRVTTLNTITIKSQITSEIEGTIKVIRPTTRGLQIILDDVVAQGQKLPLSKIRLNISKKYAKEIFINDQIKLTAKLFPPQTSIVPGGYDFGFYAYFAGISATGYALSTLEIITHSDTKASIIHNIRTTIYNKLISALGDVKGNFAAAILLGETKGINEQVMQNMRISGISHILCVSGLHLSLVAMILFLSIRFLLNLSDIIAYNCNIKLIAAISSLIGSYGYLHLSGMQIAATRAFIMTAIFMIAIMVGRTPYPLRSIAIAATFILAVNPEYVFHPSFQLSFIAVLSLISGYEFYLRNQWILGERNNIIASIRFYLASNIYSSFLASIVTAPVVINQFYTFSSYSIPMNLIAVPIMSFFLMPLSILLVILMPLNMDWLVIKSLGFFIQIIISAAKVASGMPGSVWYFGYITPLSFIIFLLGFAWVCLWQTRWRFFGIIIMIMSFILMLYSPKPEMLVDAKSQIIGIKNTDNHLEIYANKISTFHRQYWAHWFGQQDAKVLPLNIRNFISSTGQKISINDKNNKCDLSQNKDVQINMRHYNQCFSGKLNISYNFLKEVGVVAIFYNTDKCWIEYNNSRRIFRHLRSDQ